MLKLELDRAVNRAFARLPTLLLLALNLSAEADEQIHSLEGPCGRIRPPYGGGRAAGRRSRGGPACTGSAMAPERIAERISPISLGLNIRSTLARFIGT
jgi:hypothetical protein